MVGKTIRAVTYLVWVEWLLHFVKVPSSGKTVNGGEGAATAGRIRQLAAMSRH